MQSGLYFERLKVWGTTHPSFQLMQRAGGLKPPVRGPLGPWIVKLWVTILVKLIVLGNKIGQ